MAEQLGPQNVELWFNETKGIPPYFQGILEQGGAAIGAKNMQVSFRDDPAGGTWFAVTWVSVTLLEQRRVLRVELSREAHHQRRHARDHHPLARGRRLHRDL